MLFTYCRIQILPAWRNISLQFFHHHQFNLGFGSCSSCCLGMSWKFLHWVSAARLWLRTIKKSQNPMVFKRTSSSIFFLSKCPVQRRHWRAYYMTMSRSSTILFVLAAANLASLVDAHGYMNIPSSRTSIGHSVRFHKSISITTLTIEGWHRHMSRMYYSWARLFMAWSRRRSSWTQRSLRLQCSGQRRLQLPFHKLG